MNSIGNELGVDRAYIPLRDFKDRFYPGRKWKADFTEVIGFKTLSLKEKESNVNDDQSEVPSMMIDQIMEGKAIDDILAERQAVEHQNLVNEELERRQKTTSIKEDFETKSM